MKRLILISLLILLIPASAFGWYNASWTEKEPINITGNGAETSDYASMFDVYYNCCPIESDSCTQFLHRPAARYSGTYDQTYIAGVNYAGVISIRQWSEDDLTLSDPETLWTIGSYNHDDHAGCSTIVLQHQTGANVGANGTVLVAASHAAGGNFLGSRRSDSAEDISSFGASVTADNTYIPIYPQLSETSDGTIRLFSMEKNSGATSSLQIYYRTLTLDPAEPDNDSWSARTLVANLYNTTANYDWNYGKIWTDGADIHLILMKAYTNVYYIRYNGSEATWEQADGTDETLPINQTAGHTADLVHEYGDYFSTERLAIWDIKTDVSGNPHLLWLQGAEPASDGTDATADIYTAYYFGTTWTVADTGINGCVVGKGALYSGAEFDQYNMNIIYAGTPDGDSNGNSQIQAYQKVSGTWYIADGTNGTTAIDGDGEITQNTPKISVEGGDNFRPIYVLDGAGYFKILWFYADYYDFSNRDWSVMRMAYPGFNNAHYIGLRKNCRTDFEDVVYVDSDDTTALGDSGHPWVQEQTDSWRSVQWAGKWTCPANTAEKTIYIYSDNSSETYTQSVDTMDANFLIGDDFSAALDSDRWTAGGSTATSGGYLVLAGNATPATLLQNNTNYPDFLYSDLRVRFYCSDKTPGATTFNLGLGTYDVSGVSLEDRQSFSFSTSTANQVNTSSTDGNTTTQNTTTANNDLTNLHIWSMQWMSGDLLTFKNDYRAYTDTTRQYFLTKQTHTTNVSETDQGIYMRGSSTASGTVYVDWIFVRPLTTEPTISVGNTRVVTSNNILLGF
jgi:hypothetical protein